MKKRDVNLKHLSQYICVTEEIRVYHQESSLFLQMGCIQYH